MLTLILITTAVSLSVSATDADSISAVLPWPWKALMGWAQDSASLSLAKRVSGICSAEILVLSVRSLSQAPHGCHSSLSTPWQIHVYFPPMSAVPWVLLVKRHVVAGFRWRNVITRHELSHWFFCLTTSLKQTSVFCMLFALTVLLSFLTLHGSVSYLHLGDGFTEQRGKREIGGMCCCHVTW